jgi:hypothetical protein
MVVVGLFLGGRGKVLVVHGACCSMKILHELCKEQCVCMD